MKHLTHQIIALLLAFAGHCALLPAVLAETESLTTTAANRHTPYAALSIQAKVPYQGEHSHQNRSRLSGTDGITTPCTRVAGTFSLYLTQ